MTNFSRRRLAVYAVEQLDAGLSPAKLSVNLAAALLASGRHKEADLLLADIDRELEERNLLARAQVTSAHTLSDRMSAELKKQIKTLTGVQEVDLIARIDKNLLGGVKVETANHAWDTTIKKQLNTLKEVV